MDLNLDTLKREILGYLEQAEFAVFRSSPGGLEGAPTMVLWDTENYPDYQMFLDVAGFTAFMMMIGWIGQRELAATNIAFNLNTLAFIPVIGVGVMVCN